MKVNDILNKYTTGEMTLPEANEALADEGAGFTLNPDRNVITPEEFIETTAGETPDTVTGYGLMDHGVGCMVKAHAVNGKTVDVNMGEEFALVYIAGKKNELKGDTLVDPEG